MELKATKDQEQETGHLPLSPARLYNETNLTLALPIAINQGELLGEVEWRDLLKSIDYLPPCTACTAIEVLSEIVKRYPFYADIGDIPSASDFDMNNRTIPAKTTGFFDSLLEFFNYVTGSVHIDKVDVVHRSSVIYSQLFGIRTTPHMPNVEDEVDMLRLILGEIYTLATECDITGLKVLEGDAGIELDTLRTVLRMHLMDQAKDDCPTFQWNTAYGVVRMEKYLERLGDIWTEHLGNCYKKTADETDRPKYLSRVVLSKALIPEEDDETVEVSIAVPLKSIHLCDDIPLDNRIQAVEVRMKHNVKVMDSASRKLLAGLSSNQTHSTVEALANEVIIAANLTITLSGALDAMKKQK